MTRRRRRRCWAWLIGCLTPRESRKQYRACKQAAAPKVNRLLTRAALLLFRSNDKFVADSMDGDDITRVARSVFDLLAQFGDVHINRSGKREAAVSPD